MLGNWIKETTTTSGTGNITLGGAAAGFASFDGQFPNATLRYFYYVVEDGNNREYGIGHLTASTTLVRDNVLATLVSGTYTTSNNGTKITLSGGTASVYCDMGAGSGMCQGVLNGSTQGVPPLQITGYSTTTGFRDPGYQWMYPFSLPISGLYTGVRVSVSSGTGDLKVGIYDVSNTGAPDRLIANRATGLALATGAQDVSFDANVFLRANQYYYFGMLSSANVTYNVPASYNQAGGGPLGAVSTVMATTDSFISRAYASGLLSPYSGSPSYETTRGIPLMTFLRA